ncbi:unnamed protein product [Lathyrus oleraceus]|uniref:BHLH domain-containing protein n=1 Tax=Pisum sativum TaxID=3888 RepID=A0A9D5A129_PEA|nr:transcription factor bHLH74 [Pisum sativum]KAI5393397.1 hypothetical protein KIW84_060503 [Pisum sativum]
MGGEEKAMEFQHGNENIMTSEMDMSSVSMVNKPSSEVVNHHQHHPFLASSAWDNPLVSLSQAHTFGGSSMVSHNEFANTNSTYNPLVLENHQGMSSTSHLVQYSNLGGMIHKVPSYGSGSFSEMVGSFGQHGDHVANTSGYPIPPQHYNHIKDAGIQRGQIHGEQSQVEDSIHEDGALGSAPSSGNRRKRGFDQNSNFSPNKNAEGDGVKDSPRKISDGSKEHEKKPKVEQSGKQAKDNSPSGDASKDNFIHVRARRGQATNSHSLAERVRREKISERMRLLQELVPGCNKITGKAVMLDEIINYVQSLQQQVEFLSMKLATVNPELNFDVERLLSKDILQSRLGLGIGGFVPGISSSHPFPNSSFQGNMVGLPSSSTQFPPLPQNVLDHDFQSFYGMGYDSNTALDNLGPNGRLKPEL